MKNILMTVVFAGLVLLANGCASQPIEQSTEPVCIANTLPEQAMTAAQTVLTKMHFDIDKFDTDIFYVRTRPLSGAQFFEFWRKDNASAYAAAKSNLHSIRRTVELTFTPDGSSTCIQCRVQVSRLSIPETPLISTNQMSGVHTQSHTRLQTLDVSAERTAVSEWVDFGPDPDLEHRILEKIHQQLQRGSDR